MMKKVVLISMAALVLLSILSLGSYAQQLLDNDDLDTQPVIEPADMDENNLMFPADEEEEVDDYYYETESTELQVDDVDDQTLLNEDSEVAAALSLGEAVFSISPFEARQGVMFTTTLFLEEGSNLIDFQIQLAYDTDLVTLVSAVQAQGLGGSIVITQKDGGLIHISYTRVSENLAEKTNLVDLTFIVDSEAGFGSFPFLIFDPMYVDAKAHTLVGIDRDNLEIASDFQRLTLFRFGDVDSDGVIDIWDVTYLRQYLVRMRELTEAQMLQADAYYDNVVDIFDAVVIQQSLAHELLLGNRVTITFYDQTGTKILSKTVVFGNGLVRIPSVPVISGFSDGEWSANPEQYISPDFTNLQTDMGVYAFYSRDDTEAMQWYKLRLTELYNADRTLNQGKILPTALTYQGSHYAVIDWTSSNTATFEPSTGMFSKPTYDGAVTLSARIISYNSGMIEEDSTINFVYSVGGVFKCPTKADIEVYLKGLISNRIEMNMDLPKRVTNEDIKSIDKFEVRVTWAILENGNHESGIDQITRENTERSITLVATITFNGVPLEGDGKIYFDGIVLSGITEREVRTYVINKIAANTGMSVTDNSLFWGGKADAVDPDNQYQTTVTWLSKNSNVATIRNNIVEINMYAINGTALPLSVEVTYPTDSGSNTFYLSYTVSVATTNQLLVPGTNIDAALYDALKTATGTYGNLTTEALKSITFAYLDLSKYPEITDLSGLTYCTNLRVLNISGLRVTSGFNEIASLTKLEVLIARDCGLSTLSDGGIPVLDKLINLKMLDLSNNNFKSLESVFSPNKRYGKLVEMYLNDNQLEDISAITNAPLLRFLILSNNNLESADLVNFSSFKALKVLSLADNNIDSISNLSSNRSLIELRLQGNRISNVKDLQLLLNLEALYLGRNNLRNIGAGATESNISFLKSLVNLRVLCLNENQIEDISSLSTLINLAAINISDNNLTELTVLSGLSSTLQEVYAERNDISDFSFIRYLTGLTRLMLSGNRSTYQESLNSQLSGLTNLVTLTLSGKDLRSLSFISNMPNLVRLEVADCRLPSYTILSGSIVENVLTVNNYIDNIAQLRSLASTLRYLDISNNGLAYDADAMVDYYSDLKRDIMSGEQTTIFEGFDTIAFSGAAPRVFSSLYENTTLEGLYADNILAPVNAAYLFSLMRNIKFLSLENCGLTDAGWLYLLPRLVYVDISRNEFTSFNLGSYISARSKASLEYLYIDSNVQCEFANAYTTYDGNVLKELSASNVRIPSMDYLPEMPGIEYLNISYSELTDLQGSTPDFYEIFSIKRYQTLKTLDVTGVQADYSPLSNLPELEALYAVGTAKDKVFYNGNLQVLSSLFYSGVTVYLYGYDTLYTPIAMVEGSEILGRIQDVDGASVTVAADNVFNDSNPYIPDTINDYSIVWSLSNPDNYEIRNNKVAVRDYADIVDETLILTALISVYPNQSSVSRQFAIDTSILRAATKYIDLTAIGIGSDLARGAQFTFDVKLKATETEGFSIAPAPVYTDIVYNYAVILHNGDAAPYTNLLEILDPASHTYRIFEDAPDGMLESTVSVTVDIGHKINNSFISDMSITQSSRIATRTFTITYEPNGGTVTNILNGAEITKEEKAESRAMFDEIAITRGGYTFSGWYTDEALTQEFTDTTMPSHNITLYAKWQINSYIVTFDTDGGSPVDAQTIQYGGIVTRPPDPVRENYRLVGWSWDFDNDTVSSDVTITAQWVLNQYTITFNANGGEGGTTKTYLWQSLITDAPTPVRKYYTFGGWYQDVSCSVVWDMSSMTVTSDKTLYAMWTHNAVSGWVLASEAPPESEIVSQKWSYRKATYTESRDTYLNGYEQVGSRWVESANGSFFYASFPNGFDTNNWFYQNYQKAPYTASETATSKREVTTEASGYIYWHWMYDCGGSNANARAIANRQGTGSTHGATNNYGYKYFAAVYSATSYGTINIQGGTVYEIKTAFTSYDESKGSYWWYRFDRRICSYIDYYKVFQYRMYENLETNVDPTGQTNVDQVQQWVQYRAA